MMTNEEMRELDKWIAETEFAEIAPLAICLAAKKAREAQK